jgi:hypothetical protein
MAAAADVLARRFIEILQPPREFPRSLQSANKKAPKQALGAQG